MILSIRRPLRTCLRLATAFVALSLPALAFGAWSLSGAGNADGSDYGSVSDAHGAHVAEVMAEYGETYEQARVWIDMDTGYSDGRVQSKVCLTPKEAKLKDNPQ
jgi:2-methylisocitrate lyase-like PEP mutase family enzyme